MAGFVERLPEVTPPPSLQEITTEQLVKNTFKKMRAKLISISQFLQALKSNPPKDGKISGTFDFDVSFEGGNYSHHVTLDDSKKELAWEKNFEMSFMGPVISQKAKVSPGSEKPIVHSWSSSDLPKPLVYDEPRAASKQIDVFLLV